MDIGGGFPAPYDAQVQPFDTLARRINAELDRLFPKEIEILAEPGRFLVATAGTAVAKVIGKARRDGKLCYYVDDGVYHTYLRHHLRPLPVSRRGAEERPDRDLLRLRPDLRRAGHDLAGRGIARTRLGRLRLQPEHRRLQPRLIHLVQRLPAGQGRACQSVRGDIDWS